MSPEEKYKIQVHCRLEACCFYLREGERIFCTHPDKRAHIAVDPCPLYRIDWKRRVRKDKLGL